MESHTCLLCTYASWKPCINNSWFMWTLNRGTFLYPTWLSPVTICSALGHGTTGVYLELSELWHVCDQWSPLSCFKNKWQLIVLVPDISNKCEKSRLLELASNESEWSKLVHSMHLPKSRKRACQRKQASCTIAMDAEIIMGWGSTASTES